jgi:hypothetical protein
MRKILRSENMKNNNMYLSYAEDKLKDNKQKLRVRRIKKYSRYSIDSRDSIQNVQTVLLHYYGCKYVSISRNKRGFLFFKVTDGFNSHHLDRNKINDIISNLIIVKTENHNFVDFHGDRYISGKITYEEYIKTIKPFIVWEVD